MKKIISICLSVIIFMSCMPLSANAYYDYNENVCIDVTYGQTEARTMLEMINGLRKPDQAWYWNSSDTAKIYLKNLNNLSYDYELEKAAMQRAAELAVYYSHFRPDDSSFFTAFTGVYSSAGENIAYGYNTAAEVFEAWSEENENSSGQGHRRNMLNETFTAVAVGHAVHNGVHYWVQEFRSPLSSMAYTEPCDETKTVDMVLNCDKTGYYHDLAFAQELMPLSVGESKELSCLGLYLNHDENLAYTHDESSIFVRLKDVEYNIADPSVAKIEDGKVIGVSAGKTIVGASVENRLYAPMEVIVYSKGSSTPLCMHSDTVNVSKTEPTCFERGFEAGVYCNDCNTYISGHEKIPVTDIHSVKQKTIAGNTYYQCDICEKYFSDMSGKTEVSRTKAESEIVKNTSAVSDSGTLYNDNVTWTLYADGTLIIDGKGEMEFGDSVFSTPQYAGHKDKIKKVIICDGITAIDFYAFCQYTELETVVLGSNVDYIGCAAFAFCTNLQKINFPESLRTIRGEWSDGTGVFEGCDKLKNVHLNEGLQKIPESAFYGSGIENLYLPDTLEVIGNFEDGQSFAWCEKLKSIFIPESVKMIGVFSFYNCINLGGIIFEDASALEYMDQQVFDGTEYFNDPSNRKNDILYVDTILIQAGKADGHSSKYFYPENEYYVPVPDGVTMLAESAFSRCENVIFIHLPESLKYICEGAFYRCTDLVEINIPSEVQIINDNAFYRCESLKKVVFADNSKLQTIQYGAFDECSSLKEITFPESLNTIYSGAFSNCSKLENIHFLNENVKMHSSSFADTFWYNSQPDGLVYLNYVCLGWKGDVVPSEIIIAPGTKAVAENAFDYKKEIEKVVLPDSVIAIYDYSFYDCSNLKEITFPENLEIIGSYAFYKCGELTEIVFPEKVSVIGEDAFSLCSNLSGITFMSIDSVTEIYGSSFSLTKWSQNKTDSVYLGNIFYCYDGYVSEIFEFGNGTTIIAGESLISSFDFTNEIYFGTRNPEDIKTVVIPDSVTKIVKGAFEYCSDIEKVYYTGSKADWEKIVVEDGNEYLTDAEIFYNHVHSFESAGNNCENDSEIYVYCEECGVWDYIIITEKGHTPGEWEVVVEAQVGVKGKEQKKCTVCGQILDERIIPALSDGKYVSGDVNGDGKITAADARIVLRISAKLDSMENYNLPLEAFDVTGDGKLTAADARKILRISAKLE